MFILLEYKYGKLNQQTNAYRSNQLQLTRKPNGNNLVVLNCRFLSDWENKYLELIIIYLIDYRISTELYGRNKKTELIFSGLTHGWYDYIYLQKQ